MCQRVIVWCGVRRKNINEGRDKVGLLMEGNTPFSAPPPAEGSDLGDWEEVGLDGLDGSLGRTSVDEVPPARCDAAMMTSFLSGSSAVLDLDMDELQTKIRAVLLENVRLRDAIRESSASLRQQCRLLVTWREDNQRLREERRQVAEHCLRARDIITGLRRENAELRQQAAAVAEPAGTPTGPGQARQPAESAAEEPPDPPSEAEIEQRSQLSRLEAELRDQRLEVERLQSKLARQQAELSASRRAGPADWPLRQELDTLRQTLERERRQRQPPEHQLVTDGLQARILSMEELVAARGTECERLQRQLLTARRDLQAVDILKAQVDVYQQDFNQERRQREQLSVERDQLRRELQQLQARLRQGPPGEAGRLETPQQLSGPPLPPAAAEPDRHQTAFSCPKCGMAFLDLGPLQNHANRCLDSD